MSAKIHFENVLKKTKGRPNIDSNATPTDVVYNCLILLLNNYVKLISLLYQNCLR